MLMFRAATFTLGPATGHAGCQGLSGKGYNPSEGKQKGQAESSATVQGATHPTPGQHLGDEDTTPLDAEARIFQVTGQAIT
jgi:hypothetical protein